MTQVFISYSRNDMEFVQRLAGDLQSAGLDVWWDLSDIQGSDVWEKKIEEGLRSSQYFIVVLSPASLESRWVRREYLSADNKGLKIIPLKLKTYGEAPLTLRDIQPIEAINRPYEDVLFEILRILKVKPSDSVRGTKPKGMIENTYSEIKVPDKSTFSTAPTPIGILELSGLILPIVYFILVGLNPFGFNSNATDLWMAVFAILTGLFFLFRRQIKPGMPHKISLILFLMAHSVVLYGNYTGMDLLSIPEIVEALAALIITGLLLANLQSPQKPAPYSSIVLAVFLFLVGIKLILSQLQFYPSEIYPPSILAGIVSSILLWLDQ